MYREGIFRGGRGHRRPLQIDFQGQVRPPPALANDFQIYSANSINFKKIAKHIQKVIKFLP
jgi:hypothetical protein